MFQIELLELLKKFKNAGDDSERDMLKGSIVNLISENKEQYDKFLGSEFIDEDSRKILVDCEKEVDKNKVNVNVNVESSSEKDLSYSENDFNVIKSYYDKWLRVYLENDRVPNYENERIVLEIINFYVLNRVEVLRSVLDIVDTQDFEAFKNMIKNYLRKYYVQKLKEYRASEGFKSLGFFEKMKRKKKILKIYNELASCKFDFDAISEVLK